MLLLVLAVPATLPAQEDLSLDSLFSGEFFGGPGEPTGSWLPDGRTMLAVVDGGVSAIDMATGTRTTLIPRSKLAGVALEDVSKQGQKLLLYGNSRKVWRLNTRGDYWVYDLSKGKLLRLGPAKAKSELMFAKLSPDGERAAFVYRNNLYAQDLGTGTIVALTKDGTDKIVNGTFDWVHEEELNLRDGWRWSPDGSKVAYWQLDTTAEPMFTMIDNTSARYPRLIRFPFPQAGGTNASARIGVVPASGGKTTWMQPRATSESGYVARMEWAANSSELLIQMLNRPQNRVEFKLANARTGAAKTIFTDTDATWVDLFNTGPFGVAWVDGGRQFVVISERSGWRHLHAVSKSGQVRDLTPGAFDVDWNEVDVAGDTVYFTASPDNPTQRFLYRTSVARPNPARVTPAGRVGTHTYDISPTGALAVYDSSSWGAPGDRLVVSLPDHRDVRVLNDRTALRNRVAQVRKGKFEWKTLMAADGVSPMDAYLVYPPDFDPSRKYPVFFEVYGGPWGCTALDQWMGMAQGYWWMLAQKGYIVATVDNRGTPSLKGRAWRKSIYKRSNPVAAADQAAAARQLAELPFVDATRMGLWGWSGGGICTLHALFRYPEVWSLGIAVAPVPDVSLYDTIYTERYSGMPKADPEVYRQDSAISFAEGLKGSLLLVHGTGDDNCHYQGIERLIDELVKHNKAFTVMPYPNRTHNISEGEGTSRHLYELMVRYLTTNMPPGPR